MEAEEEAYKLYGCKRQSSETTSCSFRTLVDTLAELTHFWRPLDNILVPSWGTIIQATTRGAPTKKCIFRHHFRSSHSFNLNKLPPDYATLKSSFAWSKGIRVTWKVYIPRIKSPVWTYSHFQTLCTRVHQDFSRRTRLNNVCSFRLRIGQIPSSSFCGSWTIKIAESGDQGTSAADCLDFDYFDLPNESRNGMSWPSWYIWNTFDQQREPQGTIYMSFEACSAWKKLLLSAGGGHQVLLPLFFFSSFPPIYILSQQHFAFCRPFFLLSRITQVKLQVFLPFPFFTSLHLPQSSVNFEFAHSTHLTYFSHNTDKVTTSPLDLSRTEFLRLIVSARPSIASIFHSVVITSNFHFATLAFIKSIFPVTITLH